jgi:hypothetical protein
MSKISLSFFATAALCALCGMVWGILMGMAGNFTLAPAHAHLNLVGWTTLALMGGFYALAGERAPRGLGWLNYGLSASAVVVMIPSLALLLASNGKPNLGVIAGSSLAVAGMLVFLATIVTVWRAPPKGA